MLNLLHRMPYYPLRKLLRQTLLSLFFAGAWLAFAANGQIPLIAPVTSSPAQAVTPGESVQERLAKARNKLSRLEATTDTTTTRSSSAALDSLLRRS